MEDGTTNNNNTDAATHSSLFFKDSEVLQEKYKYYEITNLPAQFWVHYHNIKWADVAKLHSGDVDVDVQTCVKIAQHHRNKKALRLIAYTLFNGTASLRFTGSTYNYFYLGILLRLFAEDASEAAIAKVINDLFSFWRKQPYHSIHKAILRAVEELSKEQVLGSSSECLLCNYYGGLFEWLDILHGNRDAFKLVLSVSKAKVIIGDSFADDDRRKINALYENGYLNFDFIISCKGEISKDLLYRKEDEQQNSQVAYVPLECIPKMAKKDESSFEIACRDMLPNLNGVMLLERYPPDDSVNYEILSIVRNTIATVAQATVDTALTAIQATVSHS